MSHSYDVILNGCGPVGGIASLLLANRGFKVAVIDLNKSPYPHPRAVGLNGYSMSIIETVLKDSWKEFQFTSAVEVGYVMGITKMDNPFDGKHIAYPEDLGSADQSHYLIFEINEQVNANVNFPGLRKTSGRTSPDRPTGGSTLSITRVLL